MQMLTLDECLRKGYSPNYNTEACEDQLNYLTCIKTFNTFLKHILLRNKYA